MPIFLYRNPNTNEIREIIQSVHEEHIYKDESGLVWEREFTIPHAAIDTKNDAFDDKKNLQKIANSKGTIGNMQDYAAEQSAKREEKLGIDPIKEKMYKKYSETRGGKMHPLQRAEKVKAMKKEINIKLKKKLEG